MAAAPEVNVSAGAHAWLSKAIRAVNPRLWDTWWQPLDTLVNEGPTVIWSDRWPHDFWVSQGARYPSGQSVQTWCHRRALDDWPLLADTTPDLAPAVAGQATNVLALDRILASAQALDYEHEQHLTRFTSYLAAPDPVFAGRGQVEIDPQRLKAAFVRAWLDSVLGSSLTGLVLSATEDAELLGEETRRRLQVAWELGSDFPAGQMQVVRAVEALYATKWDNLQPTLMATQQGQPPWSRDAWFWLGRSLDAAQVREAVQVTAGLLVSPPLVEALLGVADEPGDSAVPSRCVLRRWALGLRAMAWLEEAIAHEWEDIRLADVVSFAFASIGPWWPRPSFAISHRSADAKPLLQNLRMWGDAHVAIDAMVIPSWESNTGFVWRLFAGTATIIRVRSASYAASTWCRREAELTQYLLEQSDFFRGRVVADAVPGQLAAIDRTVARLSSPAKPDLALLADGRPSFPPPTLVLEVPSFPPLIIKLLAAVCTLRILNAIFENVEVVNAIARLLAAGKGLNLPPPTNDPGGWEMHYEAFTALAQYAQEGEAPARLVADYPEQQRQIDVSDVLQRIPDLSGGGSGIDVLAGLEWNREIHRWLPPRWDSQLVVVDCRGLDADRWSADESHGIKRGILALPTESLVFITQDAGQGVDRWPVIASYNRPILTQHVADQLKWMARASILPTWIAVYLSLPDFEFEQPVFHAAFGALADQFTQYGDLAVPAKYSDVFAMDVGPDSPFSTVLGQDH